ncbi:unnamed protein product [Closterium sp. NIES-65]|nr:unnamed protein product [Closterium sp. NIES-65]
MVEHIRSMIRFRGGPISVADYMEQVLTSSSAGGYYMHRDVFGREGDFITSPEISQMFGEMVAVWAMMAWQQLGAPPRVRLVELGPGRGTLMADLLRSSAKFTSFSGAVEVHLVEVSPALRRLQWAALKCRPADAKEGRADDGGAQRGRVDGGGAEERKASSSGGASAESAAAEEAFPGKGVSGLSGAAVTWHSALEDVPEGVPTILIAHEFFDALPVHQFQKTERGWCEKLVDVAEPDKEGHPSEAHSNLSHSQKDTSGHPSADYPFRFILSPGPTAASTLCLLPRMHWAPLEERAAAAHVEVCPIAVKIALQITERVARDGGAALIVDYGEDRLISDSLQVTFESPLITASSFSFSSSSLTHSLSPQAMNLHFLTRPHSDSLVPLPPSLTHAPSPVSLPQAIRKHEFVNVLDAPGTADLSAYVDFAALRQAVTDSKLPSPNYVPITQSHVLSLFEESVHVFFQKRNFESSPLSPFVSSLSFAFLTVPARAYGPITQSQLLGRLGINFRVEALLRVASDKQAEALRDGYWRLVGDGEPPWLDEDDESEGVGGGRVEREGEMGVRAADDGACEGESDSSGEDGGGSSGKRSFVGMGSRYKALVIASEKLGVPVGFE